MKRAFDLNLWLIPFVFLSFFLSQGLGFAANVNRNTAVFSEPDESSDQVMKLEKGATAKVTGKGVQDGGATWLPVEIDLQKGFVRSTSLTLTEGDVGFETSLHHYHVFRLVGSLGPAENVSNSNYFGARASIGFDLFIGKTRSWSLGGTLSSPLTDEKSQGVGAGHLTRFNFMFSPAFYFIPDFLYIQGLAGISAVSGEDPNFDGKLKPVTGVVVGLRHPLNEKLDWGVSASYEYTNKVQRSIGTLGPEDDCGSSDQAGNSDCTNTGTGPASNVWALNFTFGFNP